MSLSVKQQLFVALMESYGLPVVWNVLNTQGEAQAFQTCRDLSSVCERLARVASSFDIEGGEFGQNKITMKLGPTVPAFDVPKYSVNMSGPIKTQEGYMPEGVVRVAVPELGELPQELPIKSAEQRWEEARARGDGAEMERIRNEELKRPSKKVKSDGLPNGRGGMGSGPPQVNTPYIVRQTPNVPEDRMPTPEEMAAYQRACQTSMMELARMGNKLGISKDEADQIMSNWMPRHERERMEGVRKPAEFAQEE